MENQFKNTENTDARPHSDSEKKMNPLFTAFVLSLVPAIYVCLVIFTEGGFLFLSIFLFPIILFVLIAPIIGMIMGISFLSHKKGNTTEKIIAFSAVVLPVLAIVFSVLYFSMSTTSLVFSM